MTLKKLLIFGGTTEGRLLAEFCGRHDIPAAVSVATDYGSEILPEFRTVRVLQGRKNAEKIRNLLETGEYDLVLDATHPHAAEVSREIRTACAETGTELIRVLREEKAEPEQRAQVEKELQAELDRRGKLFRAADATEAAQLAGKMRGGIFLTTGSKELPAFSGLPGERLFARVLPSAEALEACRNAGIPTGHISAMQGPFSVELNEAMLHETGCRVLVTKDSGNRGGFPEKLEACRRTGAAVIVIDRPAAEEGKTLSETFAFLEGRYQIPGQDTPGDKKHGDRRGRLTICGTGPGGVQCMTAEVREAILEADLLTGAARMVEAAQAVRKASGLPPAEEAVTWKAFEIADLAAAHPEKRIAVMMSGDSGFFSGTAGLRKALEERGAGTDQDDPAAPEFRVLPGISSLSYLSAACGLPWERIVPLSMHGRTANYGAVLRHFGAVFLTLEGRTQLSEIAASLTEQGLGQTEIYAGTALSLPEEEIRVFRAEQQPDGGFFFGQPADALSLRQPVCAILKAPAGFRPTAPGIPDSCFLREDKVPLTKEELRAVIISKLQPRFDSVCWDIGSGTGGVTAELSMAAPAGQVFAVECDEAAFRVTGENIRRFGLCNVRQIRGSAPECLEGLPSPDCVFVGGAHGQAKAILEKIFRANPGASAAVTAVTLETAAELFRMLKKYEAAGYGTECVQIGVSRARKAGSMSLLSAQNPVFLCVIRGRTEA